MVVLSLFIGAVALIFLPRLWRYNLKPYFFKSAIHEFFKENPKGKEFKKTAALLVSLYRGVPAERISRQERKRLALLDDNYIYGEIEFLSFIRLLEKVQPKEGEIFYDLGSGAGKPVFTAALSYDLSKACGIELLPKLCKLADEQLNKLMAGPRGQAVGRRFQRASTVQFINANFLDSDFTDGDIFFINATCLNYYTWEALLQKLTKLKPGSRIIVTTKKIQNPQFDPLYQGKELMSWGLNSVNIYLKTS